MQQSMTRVGVTQYCLPNGKAKEVEIEVPASVGANALLIKEMGYWFEVEIITDGSVSMTITDDDADHDIEVCENKPFAPYSGFCRMVDRFAKTLLEKETA